MTPLHGRTEEAVGRQWHKIAPLWCRLWPIMIDAQLRCQLPGVAARGTQRWHRNALWCIAFVPLVVVIVVVLVLLLVLAIDVVLHGGCGCGIRIQRAIRLQNILERAIARLISVIIITITIAITMAISNAIAIAIAITISMHHIIIIIIIIAGALRHRIASIIDLRHCSQIVYDFLALLSHVSFLSSANFLLCYCLLQIFN